MKPFSALRSLAAFSFLTFSTLFSKAQTSLFTLVTDSICVGEGMAVWAVVNDAASYAWSFGDGSTSPQKQPSHIFSTAGTLPVELCVATKTGQRMATKIKVLSCGQPNLAEITDLVADPYFLLKDATGQTIFSSVARSDQNPPYDLPGTILLEPGKTYEFSVYDSDFIGQDDFLGNVQIAGAAAGGAFSFGVLSIEFTTELAPPTICWAENIVVAPKPPQPTIAYDAAADRLVAEPQGAGLTFSWFRDNLPQPNPAGPSSPFFADPAGGTWMVSVSGKPCSPGWSAPTAITVAANEPTWLAAASLFPNPTDGPIQLVFGEKTGEKARLELFDAAGRMVETWPVGSVAAFSIDVSARPSGVYSLFFRDEKRAGARRVVVER